MAMAAMNMVSAWGFLGSKLSFKKMSAGGRLCTLQENPHIWAPTMKVRPHDGTVEFVRRWFLVFEVSCSVDVYTEWIFELGGVFFQ